ncbi:PqqD family protein [Haliangium ochraceum]|uniref:Coenzyme PQQ synthesis D n=1 Tax=Haliangium ochraceum (strain DSM 14365 / JCM 11303 / SMP-2) TaxID=502025 RepID=D0LIS3_HALO1|nr:PqqD family protein [Haliangium ochraceum]ACY12952.1 hypothetical protein Hoch_0311 [Haliangium ochraceum DSM 14365]
MSEPSEHATRYRRHPQTAGRIIDGQAFVVTADDNRLHTLNRSATRIWELASAGCTADDAAQMLTEHYAVEFEIARSDAEQCLADLATRRILVRD